MVLAETLGLKTDQVSINIGSSLLPNSGASGGSTTVGGVCESHRRAATDALTMLFALVAEKLGVPAEKLVAQDGRIEVKEGGKGMTWKEACALIGLKPLEVTASHKRGDASPLSNSGVGGVQMAHVAVDKETGVIKMKKFVAVQDQGLVINPKTCKSQISGAVIMGIAYSLFERRDMDEATGAFANADSFETYRLARLGDIGEIVVELYEPDDQRARGVIGNGEPPVISPGAAISNAVANALGVRVPVLPMTPKRVLEALKQAGRGSRTWPTNRGIRRFSPAEPILSA
jgi:xanthine dehydrogenase YagR molybdenum-binding subunit